MSAGSDELTNLGFVAHACERIGRSEEAVTYYEDALEVALLVGDEQSAANCLLHLGSLAATQGNDTQAREKWTQALGLLDANDDLSAGIIRQRLLELDK